MSINLYIMFSPYTTCIENQTVSASDLAQESSVEIGIPVTDQTA